MPRARHPITVDGKLDDWAEWQGEEISLSGEHFLGIKESWSGAGDVSAGIKVSWTPDGLYVAVSVVDDTYLPAADDMVVQFDCLMFMLDGRTAQHRSDASLGHGAYMVIVAAGPEGAGHRSLTYTPEFEGYTFAAQPTAVGYDAEFFTPFSEDLFPEQGFDVGREIQLSVVVVDHDEPSTGVDGLYWGAISDFRARTDPSFWKPMRLGE